MSDSEDRNSGPFLATRQGIRTNRMRTNDALPSRTYSSQPGRVELGMADDDLQPSVWEAVNYPQDDEFEFDSFYLRYERQSEAKAIIDKPVTDTWQDDPEIRDEAHSEEDDEHSEFEQQTMTFFEGEHTRRKPIHRLNVLDRLARLGEFAILVLGVGDEADDLSEPLEDDSLDGLDDLHYIATFGQDRIEEMHIDTDMSSERFRLPESFEVVVQDADDDDDMENADRGEEHEIEEIHWTRVIHVPEGSLEDDLRGTPALKPIFHELLNIDKIKAASGEGYWRAGYQGMVVSPPTDSAGEPMKFDDDGDGVEQEIREYLNNFKRTLKTTANIDPIQNTIVDPSSHLDANYQSIASALDIPKAILVGKEMADTGGSTDLRQWHQKIAQRRNGYAEPVIVEPLIQRMIDKGLLPEPDGDGFEVNWPPLDEMSESQEADLKSTKAQALQTLAGGNPMNIAELGELRQVFGWGPNIGSEIDDDQRQEIDEQQLQVDEDQLRQMQEAENVENMAPMLQADQVGGSGNR